MTQPETSIAPGPVPGPDTAPASTDAGSSDAAPLPLILIIEPDRPVRDRLTEAIGHGGQLRFADNAGEGAGLAATLRPELILISTLLPDREAEPLLRQLATAPATADVPVLMAAVAPPHASRARRLQWGARALLPHPPDTEEYAAHVAAALAERRRARQASEARFACIFHASPEGIALTRLRDSRFVDANEAFLALIGYARTEIIGRRSLDIGLWHDTAQREVAVRALLETGEIHDMPVRFWHKAHTLLDLSLSGRRLDIDGEPHLLGLFNDISLRLRDRQALEDKVRERTARLGEALRRAERLAAAKSEFLANTGHEIRTPLNGMLGMAQIGAREAADARMRKLFERIIESGHLLAGVLNDILDYSELDAGRIRITAEPVDLHACLDELATLVRSAAQHKPLQLTLDKAASLPAACLSDPLRLRQVLMNLLANAVKFTPSGRIDLQAGKEGDRLVFTVIDTGIGIPAAELAHVFDAFRQANGSSTREYGGTGLGLAITRRLVEQMGGEIHAHSSEGLGSRFEVRLPYRPAPCPAQPAVSAAPSRRLEGLSVLVVEDSRVNQLVLEEMLTAEGAVVALAGNGLQAVEQVRLDAEARFDAVLMDVQMPVMDGCEATRQLHRIRPGLPVIGQTAHTQAEERERCRQAGMADHIAKPIDLDRLVAVLRHHCRGERIDPVPAPPPPPQVPPTAPDSGAPGIDWPKLEQRYARDPAFLHRLLSVFASSNAGLPARIRLTAAAQDLDTLAGLVHGIKGMAGSVAAPGLQACALACEQAVKAGAPDWPARVETLVSGLETILTQVRQRLED